MTIYTLEPDETTLRGHLSREYPPVLTIDPGDTVRYRTLDARWVNTAPDAPPQSAVSWPGEFPYHPRRVEGDGHALIGPVAVRGAQPGMMLAIHINRLTPGTWGWSYPYYGTPFEVKHTLALVMWDIDPAAMTARSPRGGFSVPLRPFMGVMAVAPAAAGQHSTTPPYATGGNLDCKALVAGSTLYLPVAVDGAHFFVGDGHAVQGDGEISGTAIECPMRVVDLSFDVVAAPLIPTLHANTPEGWVTFGLNADLNLAAEQAVNAMLDLMMALLGIATRADALALASLVVDLRITQIVNEVRGVHAVLPHGALRG